MASVSTAEKAGTQAAPRALLAYIPEKAAPPVLATVLRIRIADVGTAISRFIKRKRSACERRFLGERTASNEATRVE